MKLKNHFTSFLLLAFVIVLTSTVNAQEAKTVPASPSDAQRPAVKQIRDRKTDFLHRLGLTEEQLQEIRKIHQEKKLLMEDAHKRFREASRALNETIYADQANEADVQARLGDLQLAQAELEKLRYMNEFAVRRVLTAEQLVRFRELRQRFEKMREEMKSRRQYNGDRTINRQHPGKHQRVEPSSQKDQQRQDL